VKGLKRKKKKEEKKKKKKMKKKKTRIKVQPLNKNFVHHGTLTYKN